MKAQGIDFKSLQDSIVCIVDWWYAASFAGNEVWMKHLDEKFGVSGWNNIKEVYCIIPYQNPFSWNFQQEHRYNFFWKGALDA